MVRALKAAGAAGGIAAAALAGAWYQLLRRPLPRIEGEVAVAGISGPVEIRRDRFGVPRIAAETLADVWFGLGFCHGQDRLFQLEFYRRGTSGRLSELIGAEGLPIDRFNRTLGLRRTAEREAEQLDPELRGALEAYCAGVNAAATGGGALPLEFQLLRSGFESWQLADPLNVGKLLALGFSTNWETELLRAEMVRELGPELAARLDPRYPAGNPLVTAPGSKGHAGDALALTEQIELVKEALGLAVEASGSNNWAVSGKRSETGSPLLAGDPHVPSTIPGIWYAAEIHLGERFARGVTLPGFPGLLMGQNNDVAWTFTNTMADSMDLFVERIEGDRYAFGDEWLPVETVREEIRVKGRAEPEVLEVRLTHHGPIVNDVLGEDAAEPLALRWTAHDFAYVDRCFIQSLEPTSGAELVEMMSTYHAPAFNMVWADRHGSIGYKLVGKLPIRKGGVPDLPKPGWTGEHEWDGWIPYEQLPETVDPKCGYLVTANNRIVDKFPHHISSDYLDGYRAQRIEQLIEAQPKHDLASFERMQTDAYSIPGVETAKRLAKLQPGGQREANAIERLRSWDGQLGPETIAGTIYQAFTLRLARELCRAAIRDRELSDRWLDRSLNALFNHTTAPWRWQSHLLALWAEGDEELIGRPWDELVLEALRGALDDLADRFGPDPESWKWGDVHGLEFKHPLGRANPILDALLSRRLRTGGGQETINQIAYNPNDPFKAIWAPSWRFLADPTDPDRSRWITFTGQSGQPGSPHYDDLQADWLAGRTLPAAGEGPWRTLTLRPG